MRVLFFEVIFWFDFWITVLEDINETGNDLFYFTLGELRAYPDDETGYFGHKDLPPLYSLSTT
jgi:hypothetical protein